MKEMGEEYGFRGGLWGGKAWDVPPLRNLGDAPLPLGKIEDF